MRAGNLLLRASAAMLCATAVTIASAQGVTAPRIYQVGEIAPNRYTVLERIWAGSWRSALLLPMRADEAGAIEAVREEARRLGADGIVNLHCLHAGNGFPGESGHFCYANAIKLK